MLFKCCRNFFSSSISCGQVEKPCHLYICTRKIVNQGYCWSTLLQKWTEVVVGLLTFNVARWKTSSQYLYQQGDEPRLLSEHTVAEVWTEFVVGAHCSNSEQVIVASVWDHISKMTLDTTVLFDIMFVTVISLVAVLTYSPVM